VLGDFFFSQLENISLEGLDIPLVILLYSLILLRHGKKDDGNPFLMKVVAVWILLIKKVIMKVLF